MEIIKAGNQCGDSKIFCQFIQIWFCLVELSVFRAGDVWTEFHAMNRGAEKKYILVALKLDVMKAYETSTE